MSLFRSIKHFLGTSVYRVGDLLPQSVSRKIAVLLYVAQNDCQNIAYAHPFNSEFDRVTPEEIRRRFQGLDEESIRAAIEYVARIRTTFIRTDYTEYPHWCYLYSGFCTPADLERGEAQMSEMEALQKRYHLGAEGEICSLVFHHGLRDMPLSMKEYVRGKAFIDAGAYIGDSTLVFMDYSPSQIIAFEPSPVNTQRFSQVMKDNNILPNQVILEAQGLSSQEGEVSFDDTKPCTTSLKAGGRGCKARLTTLDNVSKQRNITVGLIKADLEGMGLDMIQGALDTITRDKPVLSLGIYHNAEEFFEIYELLRSLDLGYQFQLRLLCAPWKNTDLTLMAFPSVGSSKKS
jgi:FkbM family methyltransferase